MAPEQAFVEALETSGYPGVVSRTKAWMRKVVAKEWARPGNFWRCAYCDVDIGSTDMVGHYEGMERWEIDHLVASGAGGPDTSINLVSACHPCNVEKGTGDWLLFGRAVDVERMKRARLESLSVSLNHLVRDPLREGWTRLKVGRVLEARWQHPRSVLFAACPPGDFGYIGMRQSMKYGDGVVAVLAGCERVDAGKHLAWRVPKARWLDVVWQLIAINSLMLRLDLGDAYPDTTPADNADDARWSETYRTVSEIVYRRHHIVRPWSPKQPRAPRPDGEPAPGLPTRPGGKLPRRPNGEGWRARRKARLLEKATEALKQIPIPVAMKEPERQFLESLPDHEHHERMLVLAGVMLDYERRFGKKMPDGWRRPQPQAAVRSYS